MTHSSYLRAKVLNHCRIAIAVTTFLGWTASSVTADAKTKREILNNSNTVIEEVLIYGRKQQQIGRVFSAAEGLVGYEDFKVRPIQRIGELAEVVPGMIATQHSGEGKANQYYLRGMNLDHGTDFSVYFEGMPLNLRAHAHGQGYHSLVYPLMAL